jgi:iron complex transport system ATP-binding protein
MDSLKFETSKNLMDQDVKAKDNSILSIENLSTGYRLSHSRTISLHQNLNFKVGIGELITLLGPNGAGKSTLLKSLVGIIPVLDGDIYYNGTNLKNLSRKEIARLVAVVLTDKIDDKYLSSYDIVGTGRYPYGSFTGKLTAVENKKIINALNVVGANELIYRYFHSLSDGEKQKVLIARAIAQDTPIILLDEPNAFIDSPGRVIIMNLLNELILKHNKTILLTTHDTELALRYATSLWLLGKENYFKVGTPDKMAESGLINQLFDREGVVFNKVSKRFETN